MRARIKDQGLDASTEWLKANGNKPVKNSGLLHGGYSKNVKKRILQASRRD